MCNVLTTSLWGTNNLAIYCTTITTPTPTCNVLMTEGCRPQELAVHHPLTHPW